MQIRFFGILGSPISFGPGLSRGSNVIFRCFGTLYALGVWFHSNMYVIPSVKVTFDRFECHDRDYHQHTKIRITITIIVEFQLKRLILNFDENNKLCIFTLTREMSRNFDIASAAISVIRINPDTTH